MIKFTNINTGFSVLFKDVRMFLYICILSIPFINSLEIRIIAVIVALIFQCLLLLNKNRRHIYAIDVTTELIILHYYRIGFKKKIVIIKENTQIVREMDSYIGNSFCETIKFFNNKKYIGEIRSQMGYKILLSSFQFRKVSNLRGDSYGWAENIMSSIYSKLVKSNYSCEDKLNLENI